MKLLLFSTLFPHAGEPTLGIFVENRLRNLMAYDPSIKVTVIAPVAWFPFKSKVFGAYGRAASAPLKEERGGVIIYHPRYIVIPKIGMLLTPWFLYRAAWRCYRKLKACSEIFDLIDAHYLFPDGVAAAQLAQKADLPFVVTARGSDVTQIGHISRPKQMITSSLKKASHVITVSENLRRDLMGMEVPAAQISTLRNGVDLSRFKETGRAELRKLLPDRPVLLFAGWLIPRKRLDIVLSVAKLLPHVTTIIVGDGPLMQDCKDKAASYGIEERVLFYGQKRPEEMPKFYSAADVLLLPSDREGWANVLLEAMACGTPVVSRAIGGAPDLITKAVAGRVVDSDKPEVLAEAILSILKVPPARDEVRKFASDFGWDDTSKAQLSIFRDAIRSYKSAIN